MKKMIPFFAAVAGACLSPDIGQAQSCKEPDGLSNNLIYELRRIASVDSKLRESLRLPRAEATSVVIVTDDTVCNRVREALDSMITANTADPTNLGPRPIYAIRIDSYYAVVNPGSRAGEFTPVFIFDSRFKHLSTLAF